MPQKLLRFRSSFPAPLRSRLCETHPYRAATVRERSCHLGNTIPILLAAAFCLFAQQPAPPPAVPANGTARFEANAQLVVETVSVRDKTGAPVKGLTAKDFSITEDGVAQTISFPPAQQSDES